MFVSIGVADRHVSIDGQTYNFDAATFPSPQTINGKPADGVTAIVWNGSELFGNIQGGGGEPFRDPAVIAVYVAAWETALASQIESLQDTGASMSKKKSTEAAAYVKLVADLKAAEIQRQKDAKAVA